MKKLLMKLTAIALCLCLALVFVACRETEDADEESSSKKSSKTSSLDTEKLGESKPVSIVGEWVARMDVTELIPKDDEMLKYMGDEKFELVIYFNFGNDGKANITIDAIDLSLSFKNLFDKMFRNSMEESFKAQGTTTEAALKQYGMTFEELMGQALGKPYNEYLDESVKEIVDELDFESLEEGGNYLFEDGKIYLYDADEEINREEYMKCILTDTSLTFTDYVSKEPDPEAEKIFKGLVFERVK